jgi:ribulose bisphosphate carboxylase small subunit
MNQNVTVRVQAFLVGRGTLGRAAGAAIRHRLIAEIDSKPADGTVRVSLQGVSKIDAGFAAEAVVALFTHYRGKRALYLADVADPDTLENVVAAAERAKSPITLHDRDGVRVIGLTPPKSLRKALEFALARPEVRVGEYARQASITPQNTSNKFRALWQQGYLVRSEAKAPSGGVEYIYQRIG